MKVVLREDVDKLGLRGEVVDVARGYARNFLLPRKLAEPATPARVKELGGESSDPMPVPNMGWFATCTDPHGNEFGIWQNDTSAPMPEQ